MRTLTLPTLVRRLLLGAAIAATTLLLPLLALAENIEGTWEGSAASHEDDRTRYQVSVVFKQAEDGSVSGHGIFATNHGQRGKGYFSGTVDGFKLSAHGTGVEDLAGKGISHVPRTFEGTISPDGMTIIGTWPNGGAFQLRRTSPRKAPKPSIVTVYFVNQNHEQVHTLMRGEAFHVVVVMDADPKKVPTVELDAGGGSTLKQSTTKNAEMSVPGAPRYVSLRATLESSTNGGSFGSIGSSITAKAGSTSVSVPITDPKIEIYLGKPGSNPRRRWDAITSDDKFLVEVLVPRKLVSTGTYGKTLEVKLHTKKADDDDTITLKNSGNRHGRVRYTHAEAATLKAGIPGLINDLDPIDVDFYDELELSLVGNDRVKATLPAYKTDTQRSIAILRANFVYLRDIYQAITAKPISKKSKEAMHRKFMVAKNAIAIMDHTRENDENWNDWKKLAIGIEYLNLLQTDSSKWTKAPQSSWTKNRYKIVMSWVNEQQAEVTGWQKAAKRIEAALKQSKMIVVEGLYTTVVTFTGVRSAYVAIAGYDEKGRKVSKTEQYLAGVEVFSLALLTTYAVVKTVNAGKHTIAFGTGRNAFVSRRPLTKIKGGGVKAEDFLTEVYGTGRHGGSQKTFLTKAGKERKLDAFDHIQKKGFESKTGRVFYSKAKGQIAKDLDILKNNKNLKSMEWHFFVSQEALIRAELKGLKGEAALKAAFGADKQTLAALKAAQAELKGTGKQLKLVFHKDLIF